MSKDQDQATPPSKEEMIAFFKEQIEVKKFQVEVMELNMRLAEARCREMEALTKMANLQNSTRPSMDNTVEHEVTQEDLDNNPEMARAGVKVGEIVLIPASPGLPPQKEDKKLKREKNASTIIQ